MTDSEPRTTGHTDPTSNDHVNPYASPAAGVQTPLSSAELGEPIGEVDVVDVMAKQRAWKLIFFQDALRFESLDGQPPVDVSRAELADKTMVHNTLLANRCLQLLGQNKLFQFSVEDFARLTEWIGPLTKTDLKLALKRRTGWIFPIGLLFIITSLPMSGDPAAGIAALPFEPIDCGLGVSLCLMAVATRRMTQRIFFLVDSLWILILAGKTSYSIFTGASWWWLILVAVQLLLVAGGVKQYRRFAAMRPSRAAEAGR